MNIYLIVLFAHSYLRWIVLLLACIAIAATARGLASGRGWTATHERLHVALIALVDAQFTLGLLLYLWLSPYVRAFFAHTGSAMKDPVLRFFGLEHGVAMIAAIAILHIARARSRRSADPRRRLRLVLLSTLGALLLIALSLPWPFLR